MPVYGQIGAAIAAALHVVFFLFESVLFKRPAIQHRFHVEPAAAEAVRPWAFNQGFYNLFLALGVVVGLASLHVSMGIGVAGARAIVGFGCGCMAAAGGVLIATDLRMARAAVVQFLPALVAVVSLFA
jgi:putative membrane protein